MSVTAYAPLGNAGRTWKNAGEPLIFDEPVLQEISKAKGKSITQVVLRFHLQRNLVVIPKSVTPSRIKENFDVFSFSLTDEEMQKIWSLNKNLRFYGEPIAKDHKYYAFHDEF
ncbi:1,5-anhydro-D-fructose reductase-like isoform X2 [Mytilus californianus]|nr:1,5-anhydro-D-fructose reductase-like isoform X1 [Mytilus californianus]XP_052103864.1 1,5-anhydro-D-fructose reductase-like isoform X2 [Mytilus californianus]